MTRVDRIERQRLLVIEHLLLEEFEEARKELDRAKSDATLTDEVRAACKQYVSVMRRMRRFLEHQEIPTDLNAKLECISNGRRAGQT